MRKHVLLLIALAILASGCGLAYSIQRDKMLKAASESDYGPPPPENRQEIEFQLVCSYMKDPESARFESDARVMRDAIQNGPMSPTPMLVWRTWTRVNGKNSYGGYTGFQPWGFAWSNGQIIAVAPPMVMRGGEVIGGAWQYIK